MDKMNPVSFWSALIKSYNRQKKCGFCWNFYAPLTEIKLNQVQLKKECCVNVFLVWDKGVDFDTQVNFDNDKGITINPMERLHYDIYFLMQSTEGKNNYNEKRFHSVNESRYETIIKPLHQCINMDIITDVCAEFGISSFSGKNIYDYQDEQYYGVRISVTTQKRL